MARTFVLVVRRPKRNRVEGPSSRRRGPLTEYPLKLAPPEHKVGQEANMPWEKA